MPRSALMPALAVAAVLTLSACGQEGDGGNGAGATGSGGQDQPGEKGQVGVTAAFYPLEFVVQRVGGQRVTAEGLTPPGAEPHDLEMGARQTARVLDADLLVHLKGFQPNVDEVAGQVGDKAFDIASAVPLRGGYEELEEHEGEEPGTHQGEESGALDPHVWLDPTLLAQVGDAVATRLAEADRKGAEQYRTSAAALRAELETLDREFREGLADCQRRDLVVSHNAFGYLAQRYDLTQVGISGLSPDAEPSAARVAEAARFARQKKVKTIFFETLVSPAVAKTVAEEVGATTAVLDPIEGKPAQGDYLAGMRANLDALRQGLDCS